MAGEIEISVRSPGAAGDAHVLEALEKGSVNLFESEQLARLTPKALGHSDIVCTNTGTGSMSCTGTYFLPKGEIVVGGVIGSRLFHTLAVQGGTGLYSNARGTLTVTSLGGKPAKELLVFRLEI